MPSPPRFKTASWRGVIRPDLNLPSELVTLTVRFPKELADDVELAAYELRLSDHLSVDDSGRAG